jgi:hypothetical protein
MPVIDTESGMRKTDGPAKLVRSDAGVPLAAGGTVTATNVQDAIDQLAAAAGGGGGISDAPNDGQLYGRKSLAWSIVPPAGLSDAPSDGTLYARKNAAWVAVPSASVTISDTAPVSPSAGNLWWNSTNGQLCIYYNDGTSSQWVIVGAASPSSVAGSGGYTPVVFTQNVSGAGNYTVAPGYSTLVGEVWGGGGGGVEGFSGGSQSGGGGGAYSKFITSVTPGQVIYYSVGSGGAGSPNAGSNGGSSWINPAANTLPTTIGCIGGGGGGATTGIGSGGSGSIGTVNYSGGNGAAPGGGTGGGGGGGAGSTANGSNATLGTGGAGGAPDGGVGGNGGTTNGVAGTQPGGGGGGATVSSGATGGAGRIKLTIT